MKPAKFVKLVVKSYNAGIGIFSKKVNAEELIPSKLDPLYKALYIFYVLQLDYAMKSQILYKGANRLCKKSPKFFTPKTISESTEIKLTETLKEYLHPRYINEALKRYRFNTAHLIQVYSGDPRKIFTNSSSCNEVNTKLKKFRGFGPKIGNFFVRTMINTFGYKYLDIDSMLPPVDVHDVKIAYLLGYIDDDKMTQKNINFVKNLWSKACLESGESWLVFDKALWLLGSEGKPKSKGDLIALLK